MTIVVRKDGTTYNLKELGIRTKDFIVSSPSYRHETEKNEGKDGVTDKGTSLDARNITCIFKLIAFDMHDVPLLRNEVFRIFNSKESFYLIDSREPGKRWEVKCSNSYEIAQKFIYGDFQVEFFAYSGYAESIGTTLDPFTFDSEKWQTGQGLMLDETMYTHSTTSFQIYNATDGVIIDPRELSLLITYKGASTNLQIKNITTGDTWAYTGTTTSGDTLTLDGVRSLKNGVSVFGNTNHKLISIAPGNNTFQLTGTSGSFTISFDFRFYTL
jgi:phage-related protein